MNHEASRRPFTVEAVIKSKTSYCGICGEQSGIGTGSSPSTVLFPSVLHSFSHHQHYVILTSGSVVKQHT